MYGRIDFGRIIVFDIPLEKDNFPQTFYFYISYMHANIEIFPALGLFSHLTPISNGYYVSQNYIMKYIDKRLVIFLYSQKLETYSEKLYLCELKKIKKDHIIKVRKKLKTYKLKLKDSKNFQIWLINDRPDEANDNGEYFFRFLKLKNPKGIKPYFIIKKNSSDFPRLKKLDNILNLESDKYKDIYLKTDKIISSISNTLIFNPFNNDQKYVRDLFNFTVVFLQNGIIKDDLSRYLHKYITQFNLFIT